MQDDEITAIRSEDYLIAIKTIDDFVKLVDDFIKKALDMAHKYIIKANDEGAIICLRAEKMAKHIKASHLEVEENILKKYIKKIQ